MTKHCRKCDTDRPVTEFSKNRARPDGLFAHCKPCCKAYRKQYHEENRSEINTRKRARYAEDPESAAFRALTWVREREQSDPLYTRLVMGASRARRQGAPVEKFDSIDLELFWLVNGIDPNRCYYTRELLSDDWELDHMTPISRGGAHAVWNVVPSTRAANHTKSDHTPEELAHV